MDNVEMVGYAEKWVANWRDGWLSLEMRIILEMVGYTLRNGWLIGEMGAKLGDGG